MLRGLQTSWKQAVAFDFTAKSFCGKFAAETVKSIIRKGFAIGVKTRGIVSDMGSCNISM